MWAAVGFIMGPIKKIHFHRLEVSGLSLVSGKLGWEHKERWKAPAAALGLSKNHNAPFYANANGFLRNSECSYLKKTTTECIKHPLIRCNNGPFTLFL